MEKFKKNQNITIEPDAYTSVDKLDKNQRVKVKIPIDPLNPKDLTIPVQINGYKWICKRGEEILLPIECKKLLEEAGYLN